MAESFGFRGSADRAAGSAGLFRRRLHPRRPKWSPGAQSHVSAVLKAVDAVRRPAPSAPVVFRRTRVNPGAAAGRIVPIRSHPYGGPRCRRVTVVIRPNWSSGPGFPSARAHLRYLERDGVARDGDRGIAYDAGGDADAGGFLERCGDDRHQYRIVIAFKTVDIKELGDPRSFVQILATEIGRDLGTRADWIAVDHFNTAQTHTHMLLRGQDDSGRSLYLSQDYFTGGLRQRASQLLTAELGPRRECLLSRMAARELVADRPGALDRAILAAARDGRRRLTPDIVRNELAAGSDRVHARLRHLKTLGLAWQDKDAGWTVAADTCKVLERMEARAMTARGIDRSRNLARPQQDHVRELEPPDRSPGRAPSPAREMPPQGTPMRKTPSRRGLFRENDAGRSVAGAGMSPDAGDVHQASGATVPAGGLKSAVRRLFVHPFRETPAGRAGPGLEADSGPENSEDVRRNWLFSGGDGADRVGGRTPAENGPLGSGSFAESGPQHTGPERARSEHVGAIRNPAIRKPEISPQGAGRGRSGIDPGGTGRHDLFEHELATPDRTAAEGIPGGGPGDRKQEPDLPPF